MYKGKLKWCTAIWSTVIYTSAHVIYTILAVNTAFRAEYFRTQDVLSVTYFEFQFPRFVFLSHGWPVDA